MTVWEMSYSLSRSYGTPAALVLDGTNAGTSLIQHRVRPSHYHLVSSPVNPVVTFGNTPVEVYYDTEEMMPEM